MLVYQAGSPQNPIISPVPSRSESFRVVPSRSESFRVVPSRSESFRGFGSAISSCDVAGRWEVVLQLLTSMAQREADKPMEEFRMVHCFTNMTSWGDGNSCNSVLIPFWTRIMILNNVILAAK